MKKTKQKKLKVSHRNTMAVALIMKKGGAHQRVDKLASRARQVSRLRQTLSDESGSE